MGRRAVVLAGLSAASALGIGLIRTAPPNSAAASTGARMAPNYTHETISTYMIAL
jgi:hypothetical protein